MFKNNTRASPVMQPVAGSLSDSEIHDLAVYFGSLKGTRVLEPASPPAGLVEAGRLLAYEGEQARSTPACFSCHGPTGHGVGARFPAIAGQPLAFIVDRLHEFQARAKTGTPAPASMTSIAAAMSESQIAQAAAYLSTLSPWPDAASADKLPAVSSNAVAQAGRDGKTLGNYTEPGARSGR
jgi:cytochrome c553